MTRVLVHIERLVLQGFAPEDRHGVAQGLQAELARRLSAGDAASRLRALGALGDVPRLPVPAVTLPQGASPQRVGQGVARGIGREIGS